MKHVKMLGLLVMATASLMAFAGNASAAPTLTSPAGTEYTGTFHAQLVKGTTFLVKAGVENTCTIATIHLVFSFNTSEEAEGALTGGTPPQGLSFGGCTQDTKTITAGSLTINDAGEVFSKGSRVEVKVTGLGITCFYGAETGSVKLGTFTGGTPAKIDVSTTTVQRETGSNTTFCALNATWTGTFEVDTPATLLIT
jgi:hypothetical protein